MSRKAYHIYKLIFLHILLYLYNYFFEIIYIYKNTTSKADVIYHLRTIFSLDNLKTSVIWSTTIFGSAQWFLIALLQAYIIFWVFYKIRIFGLIQQFSLHIAMVLLAIHIPVRVLLIKCVGGGYSLLGMAIERTASVRNVWFDALPFMLIGMYISKNKSKLNFKNKTLFSLSIIGLVESCVEYYITNYVVYPYHIDCVLYIGTIISVVSIFILCVKNEHVYINHIIEHIGQQLSMIIYFIHPIVGSYINLYMKNKTVYGLALYKNIQPILIIVVTIIIAHCINLYIVDTKNKQTSGFNYEKATFVLSSFILLFVLLP